MFRNQKPRSEYIINLLNRPMLLDDLELVQKDKNALSLKEMVALYRNEGFPIMNGNFRYSNFLEGPSQLLTCLPYRLWEYVSLVNFLEKSGRISSFFDVGGASSPLPYFLGEKGFSGVTIDLQGLLVDICNHVANNRKLPIKAVAGSVITDFDLYKESYDLVTSISVLEHINSGDRLAFFGKVHRLLRKGGIFYMTFDYGGYSATSDYIQNGKDYGTTDQSIGDLNSLNEIIVKSGFKYVENNPLFLPSNILACQEAPDYRRVTRKIFLNIGPVDSKTPWWTLFKYVVKRMSGYGKVGASRYARHNFFRLFLEKV